MFNKAFPAVPDGEVRVETPDGVVRTFGDVVRVNLTDAGYVDGPNPERCAYGAFPTPEDRNGIGYWDPQRQPTMRKSIDE